MLNWAEVYIYNYYYCIIINIIIFIIIILLLLLLLFLLLSLLLLYYYYYYYYYLIMYMYCTSIAVSGLILTVSRSETRLRCYRVVSQNQWLPQERQTKTCPFWIPSWGAVGSCNHCLVRALGTCFHQDLRIPESFFSGSPWPRQACQVPADNLDTSGTWHSLGRIE